MLLLAIIACAALALSRLMQSLLFDVSPSDPFIVDFIFADFRHFSGPLHPGLP
jgi:hypothetical protein